MYIMKKYFLILFGLLLVFNVKAQVQFGVKAGGTFGKIDGASFKSAYNFGINAGVFADIHLIGGLGIQPEVLFNQTNTTVQNHINIDTILNQGKKGNLNYLSIPILLRYKLFKILYIQAGPQFGILMNPHNTLVQNGTDAFKSGDLSLVLGAQLNLGKVVRIYGRYNIGLTNVNDISNSSKWTNQQIQAGVGFALF